MQYPTCMSFKDIVILAERHSTGTTDRQRAPTKWVKVVIIINLLSRRVSVVDLLRLVLPRQ